MINLTEIKARCERATRGPWKQYNKNRETIIDSDTGPVIDIYSGVDDSGCANITMCDVDFITNSRADLPECVRLLEEAREIIRVLSSINYDAHEVFMAVDKSDNWLREVQP